MDFVAALAVGFEGLADGVVDFDGGIGVRLGLEVFEEVDFFCSFREEEEEHIVVAVGHGVDFMGLGDDFRGDLSASYVFDIDADFFHGGDGVGAWGLIFRCCKASRGDGELRVVLEQMFHEAFCHGASADVSGADKEDVFHGGFLIMGRVRRLATGVLG